MRILALLFATLLIVPTVEAQQKKKTIAFRTICFRHENDIKEVLVPAAEKDEMLKVPLLTSTYSEPMKMRTINGIATFSIPNPDAKEEGDPSYLPIGRAKVPDSTLVLFLFLPTPEDSKMPYRVVALADDERAFPWGNIRLLNIAALPARFHIGEHSGEKAKTLPPGKMVTLSRIRKVNQFNMYNVRIEFVGKNGPVPVSNTRWKSVDGKRDLAIAYIDPKSRRPVVNLYKDVQPADL